MMKLNCESCKKGKNVIAKVQLCEKCMIKGLVILYKTEKPS